MLELPDIIARLAAAMAVGSVVGLNRNLKGKAVGMRTLGLVGLGSAILVIAAGEFGQSTHIDAISRAMQGIITGIGFLGAGVILRNPEDGAVHGLTTAASVWVTACLGIVCGMGAWRIAIVALGLTGLLLMLGGKLEKKCRKLLGHEKPNKERHDNEYSLED